MGTFLLIAGALLLLLTIIQANTPDIETGSFPDWSRGHGEVALGLMALGGTIWLLQPPALGQGLMAAGLVGIGVRRWWWKLHHYYPKGSRHPVRRADRSHY